VEELMQIEEPPVYWGLRCVFQAYGKSADSVFLRDKELPDPRIPLVQRKL
jgi:hypothetical protein